MAATAEWHDPDPVDEPEPLGAISLAGRGKLDNLIFVVNFNLQSLESGQRHEG